jgi:Bacterial Ig domain
MARRKQVYKITYPNGKIYVGMDLTGALLCFGSPSAHEQIAADLGLGGTYGVGTVIVAHFDEQISDRAAAERQLSVTTNPPVQGFLVLGRRPERSLAA